MKSVFRATTPQDEATLISFLARAFSSPLDAEFLQPDLIRWKFWAAREDYSEPRSFVLEQEGKIVAHAGIWPLILRTKMEKAHGAHMIDWASDPRSPGSGVALLQRLCNRFDFIYAIGGSQMTQRVLPAFGFKTVAQAWSGARPLRPIRQMLSHPSLDWKSPGRFARNALWSMTPLSSKLEGWTVDVPDLSGTADEAARADSFSCAPRPNAFFRYLECCPVARITVVQLQKDGREQGRMALSLLHQQARVAGVWLNRASPENLRVAYGLAQQAARRMRSALEIAAFGSTSVSARAADSAGLRIRSYQPVYLLRRKGTTLPALPFEFQAADNDAAFLSEGRTAFLT